MNVVLGELLTGRAGTARHVAVPEHPSWSTAVCAWFIHQPGQLGGLDWFLLTVVSLTEKHPDPRPPILFYPQAEFEVLISSLYVGGGAAPCEGDLTSWQRMEPVNYVEQFHGTDWEQAARVGRVLAQACVEGDLPGETQMYTEIGGQPGMHYIRELLMLWREALGKALPAGAGIAPLRY